MQNVTLALVLMILCDNSRWLIKEPVVKNPFRLVYRVIRYAIKNKQPRQRSAFTYCEDYIPSRIDFGKMKYGGPFTTEQVEDVKTVLWLLPIIIIGSVIGGEFFVIRQVRLYFTRRLTHCTEPYKDDMEFSLTQCYNEASFLNIFNYSAVFLIKLSFILCFTDCIHKSRVHTKYL